MLHQTRYKSAIMNQFFQSDIVELKLELSKVIGYQKYSCMTILPALENKYPPTEYYIAD